ncbi:unnamed protein product [Urochloa decumbens]|uniref:HORMA domain-containing protein n=1 Tax=Urochloa decumbens TaxID=240449 RepID=A0ABC9EXN9_9POAL
MVVAQKTKEAEITEQDSLLLTRNLLRIAIYNISYIRGLFHEKYFSDKSVPALEMKIKKLMPMDAESRRLIDWMEKGVYDALQKKYLKTLLFCICEKKEGPMIEEYAFSFSYPNTSTEEVAMNMSRTGSKKGSTTFTSNASEVTPDQMRSSACKMIRTLVSLMRTLDPMPEERTILMKLLYYDDVTPEDYEPPFFKGCADNEAINIWNKNPLKMEVGNVNSKHLVLALKVKSVLDPCDDNNVNSGDDGMSVDNDTDQDDDFSYTEVRPSEADRYVVAPNDGKCKGQNTGTISEDDTQDAAHEEELTAQVKQWICSRETGSINVSDVLSNFPDISMEMVEDIMERLLKDGVLSRASKDGYPVNQTVDPKTSDIKKEIITQNVSPTEGTKQNNGDLIYMKALYHALPMDYVTIAKLQGKLDGEATQNTVRKLIDKMVQDGYVKNSANRRLGKAVIHSESSNRKLLDVKRVLESNEGEQMAIDTKAEHSESERKDLLKDEGSKQKHAFNAILNFVLRKRTFSSYLWDATFIKNFAVVDLSGSCTEVLISYIKAITKYRFWNMACGTAVDIGSIFGVKMVLYTVRDDETFHFILKSGDDVVDVFFDGLQAWFHGAIKEHHSFQFKNDCGTDPYVDIKVCQKLNFTGSYLDLTEGKNSAGQIRIGLSALLDAFFEIKNFKGDPTSKFKAALATIVIHFGESPKFHKVLLACCMSIIIDEITCLDHVDPDLGLAVRRWGKLCGVVMQIFITALSGGCLPSLDEEIKEIKDQNIPGILTIKDVMDNICIWTHNSVKVPVLTVPIESRERSKQKNASELNEKPKPTFCIGNQSSDPSAEKIRAYYRQSMAYGVAVEKDSNAEGLKDGEIDQTVKESDAESIFVERHKARILQEVGGPNMCKNWGANPFFRSSTWGSNLPFKHTGKVISEPYVKAMAASSVHKPQGTSKAKVTTAIHNQKGKSFFTRRFVSSAVKIIRNLMK